MVIGTTEVSAQRPHALARPGGRAEIRIGAAAQPKYNAWEWAWSRWSNGMGTAHPARRRRRRRPIPVAARYTATAAVPPRVRGRAIFPDRIGKSPTHLHRQGDGR